MLQLETIDFSKLNEATERGRLDAACRSRGFFGLANHGIDSELQRALSKQMQRYFAQPEADKLRQERTEQNPFGFYNRELTKNRLDLKEVFDINLNEETLWPDDAEFIEITSAWSKACHEVSISLLNHLFTCLGRKPEADMFAQHTSFLRLNYYAQYQGRNPGDFGVSHHTDAGALTLLLQEQVASLQFEVEGIWHTVPADSDLLYVNLGDMLQVWSNDLYIAPIHRVITNSDQERYSAPYFLNPSYEANIIPLNTNTPNYREINWGEFRSGRAAGDYADLGEEIQISQYRLSQ